MKPNIRKMPKRVFPFLPLLLTAAFVCGAAAGDGEGIDAVPKWLDGYDIRPGYIPGDGEPVGAVERLQGRMVIIRQETGEAFFAKPGDPIFLKDLIATLDSAVCRIRFSSRDTASLSTNTILTVESYLDDRSGRRKSATLRMKVGRAFFYVLRLLGYREIDVRVKTPSSVAAVRGTKFGLNVYRFSDPADGRESFVTDCYCADGLIEIDGAWVSQGELYRGGTGKISPASPGYVTVFHRSLELAAPSPPVASVDVRGPDPQQSAAEQTLELTESILQQHQFRRLGTPADDPERSPGTPAPNDPPVDDEPPVVDPPETPPAGLPTEEPPVDDPAPPEEDPETPPAQPPPEEPPMDDPPVAPKDPPEQDPETPPDLPPGEDDPVHPHPPETPPAEPPPGETPGEEPPQPPWDPPPDDPGAPPAEPPAGEPPDPGDDPPDDADDRPDPADDPPDEDDDRPGGGPLPGRDDDLDRDEDHDGGDDQGRDHGQGQGHGHGHGHGQDRDRDVDDDDDRDDDD